MEETVGQYKREVGKEESCTVDVFVCGNESLFEKSKVRKWKDCIVFQRCRM